ncbi:MAG: hypothetical protein AAGA56_11705 [Myxococcota bacterium]
MHVARRVVSPLAILLCLPLSACSGIIVGTQTWFDTNQTGKALLARRASFDLSCPAEQLSFMCLQNCETAGVSGCGQKASYVYVDSGWVLNSDSKPTAAFSPERSGRDQDTSVAAR